MKTTSYEMSISAPIIHTAIFLLHISCSLGSLGPIGFKSTFYQLSMAAFLVAISIISLIYQGCKAATYLVSGTKVAALVVCRNDYSGRNTYNNY